MHEIVTLQLGQRSNYLATHFWNTQESYFTYSEDEQPLVDHDVHFRAGIGADGSDTYNPRTLIYDLKGGFGSLRKYNALYDLQDDGSGGGGSTMPRGMWDGTTLTQQQASIEPNEYQRNLEQGVPTSQLTERDIRYWSDFNRVYYHPRSIVQLNEYELNSQILPFENWTAGQDLFKTLDKEFELLDRDVRPFAEECDQMAGLQVIAGTDDAWGGFSANYVEGLRDEYGKTPIWLWALEDGTRVSRIKRSCNAARSIQSLTPQVSAYIRISNPPVTLPSYVSLGAGSEWDSAALASIAMESATLPTRLRQEAGRQGSFSTFETILNVEGRQNIFELFASIRQDRTLVSNGHSQEESGGHRNRQDYSAASGDEDGSDQPTSFDIDYTPEIGRSSARAEAHKFGQIEVRRGLGKQVRIGSALEHGSERTERRMVADSVVEVFGNNLRFPLLDTFPATLLSGPSRSAAGVRVNAGLATTSWTKTRLAEMGQTVSSFVGVDEREVLLSDLADIGSAYEHGWDSGSDWGGDD